MADAACARGGGCRHWRVPGVFGDPATDAGWEPGRVCWAQGLSEISVQDAVALGSGFVPIQEHQQWTCAVAARAS